MPLQNVLGPFDRRKRLTRCSACARRKIRCQGGYPCEYCSRTRKTCLPQEANASKLIVVQDLNEPGLEAHDARGPDRYLPAFHTFISHNQLTLGLKETNYELSCLLSKSVPFQCAAAALGALMTSREYSVTASQESIRHKATALRMYSDAAAGLRSALTEKSASDLDAILWSTMMLSLFELAVAPSISDWLRHFIDGGLKLLHAANNLQEPSRLRVSFIEHFLILDAHRALLYGTPTSEVASLRDKNPANLAIGSQDTPVAIPNIVPYMQLVANYNARFHETIISMPKNQRLGHPSVIRLGLEGLEIRDDLNRWRHCMPSQIKLTSRSNSTLLISFTYYHALIVFLSVNCSYYNSWSRDGAPHLSEAETNRHLQAILTFSEWILDAAEVSGLLLFFPLRVAGTTNVTGDQQRKIQGLLDRIRMRGFEVTRLVKGDLKELWSQRVMYNQEFPNPTVSQDFGIEIARR